MHFIYHPEHEAKIVDSVEFEKLLKKGWFDSPAKFPVKEEKIVVPYETKDEGLSEVIKTKEVEAKEEK